ncbi:PIN domain-containing protein [Phormidesmis priestleyi]
MKTALIDTDILSLFFRGNSAVVAQFQTYVAEHTRIQISIVTYYEILSGLKHRDSQRQLSQFLAFTAQSVILPLTLESIQESADLYATLRQRGVPVDDIDLLIAGVAIANNLVLVTHNQRHFSRIEALELQDWSQS